MSFGVGRLPGDGLVEGAPVERERERVVPAEALQLRRDAPEPADHHDEEAQHGGGDEQRNDHAGDQVVGGDLAAQPERHHRAGHFRQENRGEHRTDQEAAE